MLKKASVIHTVLSAVAAFILLASLVFYLVKWSSLPQEPGIHFAPDGSFDVYASKVLGFYPHLMGGIAIAGLFLAGQFSAKKNIGLALNEKGDRIFRSEIMVTLGAMALFIGLFFTMWSVCVATQTPMNDGLARNIITAAMIAGALGLLAEVVTCVLFREKRKGKSADIFSRSRVDRMGSWVLTGGGLFILLWCYERLPLDDLEDKYHGLAYFANLGRYLDKRLLFVPYILLIPTLAVLEIVSAGAKKNNRPARARFAGRLCALDSFFVFWWVMEFMSEIPVGAASLLIFAGLTALSTVIYVISENKEAKQTADEPLE